MSYIDWIHKTWTSEKFSSYSVRPPLASTSRISPARSCGLPLLVSPQPLSRPHISKAIPNPIQDTDPAPSTAITLSVLSCRLVASSVPSPRCLHRRPQRRGGRVPGDAFAGFARSSVMPTPLPLRHMKCSMFCCFIHDPIYA